MIKNDLRSNPDYSKFIYFDLETDGTEVLDVGVSQGGSYTVMSFDDFCNFIYSLKDATLVAHYGANFDFLFLLDRLIASGYEIRYAVSGSNGIAMFCQKGKTVLRFIDSFRIASVSLTKFSESFSPDYTKIKIDCLPSELKNRDRELYYEYLKHDVLSLEKSYLAFMSQFSEYKLGKNPPLTAASLAMKVFKNHLDRPIFTSSKKTREYEFQSYFGGVCWLKRAMQSKVNVYDINSMYPFIMQSTEFPSSYLGHWCDRFTDEYEGLWDCTIEQPYGGVPFTFDYQTRQLAKSGRFILDRATIRYLQSQNVDVKITAGYVYLKTSYLFNYYREIYDRRVLAQRNGEIGKAYALKIILNSLYGKFGQKDISRVIKSYSQDLELKLLREKVPFNTDSRFILYDEYRDVKTSFPAIASLVTLRSRLLLRQYSDSVDLIYCDTDSLHIPIDQTLPTSSELGGLKLEYSGEAIYIAKKLYAFLETDKLVHKGVPKKMLTLEDYFAMLNGDRVKVNFSTLPTVNDVIVKGIRPGSIVDRSRTLGITNASQDDDSFS
jgi:DNA polymerase elongation subunit (family B)